MNATAAPTLTLHEVAERLGVHYMTAYRYVRLGLLEGDKVGGAWQIGVDAVEAFEAGAGNAPVQAGSAAPWAERLEARLVDGDAHGSWLVVESAMTSGADARSVYTEMLAPSMVQIGERWRNGELDIAVEHQATGIAMRIIGRLSPRFIRRGRSRGGLVVGAPSGEAHALTSVLIADLMRLHGWEVRELGANTPPSSFVHAARSVSNLRGIGISVTYGENVESARGVCQAIRHEFPDTLIVMGGLAIESDEHARSLGADAGAFDADTFDQILTG